MALGLVDLGFEQSSGKRGCGMDDLTREFLIESQEGLDRMERCLTELESKPSDTGLLAEIFRTVHTIKGTVGFLGFKRLEKLAHSGENLLGLLREGKLAADEQVITGLLQLQYGLRSILKSIEDDGNEGDDADVCREGNRHVGIAVSHVLDVAAGGDLFEAGTNKQAAGVTLLKTA